MSRSVSVYLSPGVMEKLRQRAWKSSSQAIGQIIERYDYLISVTPRKVLAPPLVERLNYYVREELPDHPLLLRHFSSMVEPELKPYVRDLDPLGVVALLDQLECGLVKRQELERKKREVEVEDE